MNDFMATMIHYHWREGGEVVVQNMVGGMKGQTHRHSPEGFKRWIEKNGIKEEHLVDLDKD